MGEEGSVLRLGGIAGLLAGIVYTLGLAVDLAGRPAFVSFEESLRRFPEWISVHVLGFGLILAAVILAMALFLALYRALRGTSPALALFGGVLGVLGLLMFAFLNAFSITVLPLISDLFAAAETAEEEQTIILLYQVGSRVPGLALGLVAISLVSAGFISLGAAMFSDPDFRKGLGSISMAFGVVGLGAQISLRVAFTSVAGEAAASAGALAMAGVLPTILLIVFLLLFGWKVYSLSSRRSLRGP
ncbi:MAG: hypothetical protein ACE5KH_04425 [Candidatus Geothermarchaeales archaeon]